MIDIHVHILPGFDDGAADIDTAREMAAMAVANGIHTVIATPHVISGVSEHNSWEIATAVEELNLLLTQKDIALKVCPGAEYYLEPDLPARQAAGELLTLNNSKYLLIELPAAQVPVYTEQVLYELQLQGITPVIAHPERNNGFITKPKLLGELIKKGNLSQITTGSVTGLFGQTVKKTALFFLRQGWGHVIASDAHSNIRRIPELLTAAGELKKIGGDQFSQSLLIDNPLSIMEGNPLQPLHPISARKSFFHHRDHVISD
ncbi:MAG TPA: phosphotransferase [Syntrophomonadaceae bacterium]|nr:phosphotransferase [Syntrophomonadaceae bacterium]HNX29780.1 phosphotransferase [Syntrophomonadaceae bacterium]HPR94426.1 phosphotransferase [Syntrophomonadaceae bacterium]